MENWFAVPNPTLYTDCMKNKEETLALIQKLVDDGILYLIENNKEGCYQLAYREGEVCDATTDPCWELDVEEYNDFDDEE